MGLYASIENNIIANVFIADSEEIAKVVCNTEVIDVTEKHLGIGWFLDNNIWYPPKPYPSWIWNNSFWQAPVEYPIDGLNYNWDEDSLSWIKNNNT